ncbi:isochorismate synthase, partial [Mycobacterium colombiense]
MNREDDDARGAAARQGVEQRNPEPLFALCGPTRTLIADGVRYRYPDVGAAQAALRSGEAPIVLG